MTFTIQSLIDKNARLYPNQNWVTCAETGKSVTWLQVKEEADRISKHLKEMGLEKGQSVGIAGHNSLGNCLAFLGICYGGFLATPLNLVSGEKALQYVVKHSEVKLIITNPDCCGLIKKVIKNSEENVSLIGLDPSKGPIFKNMKINRKIQKDPNYIIQSTDPTLLMYTSGTTGNPKGVLLSHSNLIAAGSNVHKAHNLTTSDIAMCVLPIYHINGLCVTILGTVVSASELVMPFKFSLSKFWDDIERYSCTWFSAVPTLFSYLLNDKTAIFTKKPKLKFARSASAPLSPDIHVRFEKRFSVPIIETMGLTETGAQILSNPMPPKRRKIGSPGKPIGNEIMIGDYNQNPVSNGTMGEILVRGKNVMLGYLKQPKESAKTITKEGWLRTGDIGYADSDGFIFVKARIKELIIKGGENISPREIDEVLLEHKCILEAGAFAVPCKNYGHKPEACVILKEGMFESEKNLRAFCVKRLGAFKAPSKIHIQKELPKGPSGKIQRLKLFGVIYPTKDGKLIDG